MEGCSLGFFPYQTEHGHGPNGGISVNITNLYDSEVVLANGIERTPLAGSIRTVSAQSTDE